MQVRLALASVFALGFAVPVAPTEKSIIVTVVDQSGVPIKGVTPGDLVVQEDASPREVVEVTPLTEPMTIALLVDNTKPTMGKEAPTRELRAGLTAFVSAVQAASPESTIGIWEFAGAGVMIQKPTAKAEDLTKKINRMFPSLQSGGVMLEALVDASKELNKKGIGPRRIIVSVSFNSPEVEYHRAARRRDRDAQGGGQLLGARDRDEPGRVHQLAGQHAQPRADHQQRHGGQRWNADRRRDRRHRSRRR